jgi:predicted nuclease of predicted toxin-antitoxin system
MTAFVIDEDMPRSVSKALKERGYAVKDIRDYGLRGADDEKVYQFAQNNQSALITGDMGFSNILRFPTGCHFGIVIAHFPNEMSAKEINSQLLERLGDLTDADIRGNLVIIEPGKVKVRRA